MKKLLCLVLSTVILISAAAVFSIPAAASTDNKLIVMDNERTLAEVEVGNEFIYRVGLFTGPYLIYSGQGNIKYDSKYVQIVEYGKVTSSGRINMDFYCFPSRIYNTNLTTNYLDVKDNIYYNFTKYNGMAFESADDHYFKIRFKAIAPGTVQIQHIMERMTTNVDNKDVPLFFLGKANTELDPAPYTLSSAEPATAFLGDADGDDSVTVMDATLIQRVTAGVNSNVKTANADVNTDNAVNLKDALLISRYNAGMSVSVKVGEWIFPSEQ